MLAAAGLMALTGLGFAGLDRFWPLAVVAFFGTLNPSSGDVSLFLPLEHARLAGMNARTRNDRRLRPSAPSPRVCSGCNTMRAWLPCPRCV